MITYHKATADTGGAIGTQILSGVVAALLPAITTADQTAGVTISRKFYIASSAASDVNISNLSLDSYSVFATILFESSGDAQVVGDLTGSETDESPITVTIPASGHKSFWIQVDVPTGSTKTEGYNTIDLQSIY